jgi:hypothetical protein
MIQTRCQPGTPWKFADGTASNASLVTLIGGESKDTEKSSTIIERNGCTDDFLLLSFHTDLNIDIKSLSFQATAKFVEVKSGTSSLAVPQTIRGKTVGGDSFFSFSVVFPKAIATKFVFVRLLRLQNADVRITKILAELSTLDKPAENAPSFQRLSPFLPSKQQQSQQQSQQQQMLLLMTMQQKFVGLVDNLRRDVNKRFDELDARVKKLEVEIRKD